MITAFDSLCLVGYGVMLRQAWPYGTPQECGTQLPALGSTRRSHLATAGLAFHAFSNSLPELESALVRMAGEGDGVVDALFTYTTNTHSNYYYCPTLPQLAALAAHAAAPSSA